MFLHAFAHRKHLYSGYSLGIHYTVECCYNKDLGTMKITLLYQVSCYSKVKNKESNITSWDQQNYLVKTGFCYIRPLYEVPLHLSLGLILKESFNTR